MKKKRKTTKAEKLILDPAYKWPEDVPVLRGKDFDTTGYCNDRTGAKCLLAWLECTFEPDIYPPWKAKCRIAATEVMCDILKEVTGNPLVALWNCEVEHNLTTKNLAWIWNETLRRIGYEWE